VIEVAPLSPFSDVKVIKPRKFGDARGFFSETYNERALRDAGIDARFVQDNHAFSKDRGVIRGLHYQLAPKAQDKLIRVVRGAILDVVVDVRVGSPTFGRQASIELSAENWLQLWVPVGFAHGYCTLTTDSEVIYKVTDYYAPDHEGGVLWSDPALGIPWPVPGAEAILSDKDRKLPLLADMKPAFQMADASGT
jgi:dTDP-4-dehydrorhamnose 3,5-epimerase